ncbi:MAG TPA: universal stress protein [Thermoleophilaceae bacterium]
MSEAPILICFDGSDEAKHAIEQAGAILAGGRAIVLNTWELLTVPVGGYGLDQFAAGIPVQEVETATRDRAEKLAADGAELARAAGFEAEPAVAEGPPAAAIVDTANERGAKLIVIGSRGYGGLKGSMMGSVSNQVVHHAPCPVLVVKAAD